MNLEEFTIKNNQLKALGDKINILQKEVNEMNEDHKILFKELRMEARLQNYRHIEGKFTKIENPSETLKDFI